MTRVPFAKMHGAGNDFVVVDCLAGDPVPDWKSFARFSLDEDEHRRIRADLDERRNSAV